MTLEEYMRELVLMSRQYGQEEELYPLINMLLRENDNVRHLSVRDVHNHAGSGMKKAMLYGYASFPDLAILDEEYFCQLKRDICDDREKIYGCVEAKIFNHDPLNKDKKYIPIFNENGIQEWKLEYPYIFKFGTAKENDETKWNRNEYISSDYEKKNNIGFGEEHNSADVNKYRFRTIKKEVSINFEKYNKYKIKQRCIMFNNIIHNQLFSELLWYGRVLYTDGLNWYYLELTESSNKIINKNVFLKQYLDYINNIIIKAGRSKEILDNDDTVSKFANAISSIEEIEVMVVKIGNLKEIYDRVYKKTEKEQRISVSAVGQYLTYEDRQKWNRLKYNIASINWCGTNTADQFLKEPKN